MEAGPGAASAGGRLGFAGVVFISPFLVFRGKVGYLVFGLAPARSSGFAERPWPGVGLDFEKALFLREFLGSIDVSRVFVYGDFRVF
jgi:hypothetical protein